MYEPSAFFTGVPEIVSGCAGSMPSPSTWMFPSGPSFASVAAACASTMIVSSDCAGPGRVAWKTSVPKKEYEGEVEEVDRGLERSIVEPVRFGVRLVNWTVVPGATPGPLMSVPGVAWL